MANRTITTSLKLDGEQEFKKQLNSVNSELKNLKSELALNTAEFKGNANSVEALSAKQKILQQQYDQQKEKVSGLSRAYEEAKAVYGENSKEADKYRQALNYATAQLINMDGELKQNAKYLEEAEKSADGTAESIDEYGKEVKEAEKETSTFGDVLKANLTSEAIIAGLKAIVNGIKAVTGAFSESISATAEYGDNIDKMSQKMGLSAESYQEWDFIMQHCGTSIENLKAPMKTLATAAETGSAAFDKLGISQQQIATMSQEELFNATIAGLSNVTDETERTYLAGQLLGRGATELGALLNTSAEDIEGMRQQVHDIGGVMSNDAVKAAAAYQDSLQNLQYAFAGMKRDLSGEFLPAVTTVMDGLTMVISGNVDEGVALIEQGVEDFGEQLKELGPFAQQALDLIARIITDNLPMILECAGNILISLVNGLCEHMPELIPVVIDLILTIVNTLIDNLDLLIDCAIKLVVGLATGIIRALPQLAAKMPQIIKTIVVGLANGVKSIASVGKDIVAGLWSGISNSLGWIKDKIRGWVGNVVSFCKKILGINSPSKVMEDEVGEFMGEGVGSGFVKSMENVKEDIDKSIKDVIPTNMDIAASIKTSSFPELSAAASTRSGSDTSDVVAAIKALGDKIDRLQIVLDSGEVVGGVIDKVDKSLGARCESTRRGSLEKGVN